MTAFELERAEFPDRNDAGAERYSNPRVWGPIGEIVAARLDRRNMLRGMAAVALGSLSAVYREAAAAQSSPASSGTSTFTFQEVWRNYSRNAHCAGGHEMQVLLRWGDRVQGDSPAFDPHHLAAAAQEKQFGYNCDYIAFLPLPRGSENSDWGLLCVNHEYTDTNLMFSGITGPSELENLEREQVDVELAAMGHSIVEIRQQAGHWHVVEDGSYNRRLTARTPMAVSGPAAGHPRLRTSEDPTGRSVQGTLNNCAGGVTPWGTVLICEENFDDYFMGAIEDTPEERNHRRYGIRQRCEFHPAWSRHYPRFDVAAEPNEPNRFGWVVEVDPFDPQSVPVKRTALGRFKHEGAGVVVNGDGRLVVYSGDDESFDYLYKFVSTKPVDPDNRAANRDLLDDGVLFAARFEEDGRVEWLPLVHGYGPLTSENGFHRQADVLIETRRAADLLGATPMDRPEDVEPNPLTGDVYVILTNNPKRGPDQTDAANPRPANTHGHILELRPPRRDGNVDHAAPTFGWNVFLRAGNPFDPADGAEYHPGVSRDGWFSCPDNSTFDNQGRLWITTDGSPKTVGSADGVYACDTAGAGRALPKVFFTGPRGSEVSGLCFTPDNQTLFIAVQHPGEEPGSDFDRPSTRWPDFRPDIPPRPAVVAVTKTGGGTIGS